MYLSITLLCAAVVPGFFCYEDIHKYMSPTELRHVFYTDGDTVPEYEVVRLHMSERSHKRGLPAGTQLHTIAFGKKINLWIHPRDSNLAGEDTPVYYAKYSPSAPQGVQYRRGHGLMKRVGQIFEDPINLASLVIGTEYKGRTRVNGYVQSKRIAIRSLPQRVADEYTRRRRSVDGLAELEHPQYSPYHVVIRMNETFERNYKHSPVNETGLRERLSGSVQEVPHALYPEILVVVENSVYKDFETPQGHNVYGLLEYLLAFWNGVDLKYRSITNPRFRFHISAIILAEDPEATPYIAKNMVGPTAFETYIAMPQSRTFFYGVKDTFPLDSYDIATTMTRFAFGIKSGILGQAWVGSACQRDDMEKTMNAVTIHYDDGVFSGVFNVAHELGHIFGAHHDYKNENCVYNHGFIMSHTPWYTTNTSDFSRCSLESMQNLLKNQKLTCLYNRPHKDGPNLPKLMPGRMKNLKAQCNDLRGGVSCQDHFPEHSICVNMFCFDQNGKCVETGTAALDGTQCGGRNEFCLHQRCVSL